MSYNHRNSVLPDHTKASIDRYVNQRAAPGGFLSAVISNDLVGAVSTADNKNLDGLPAAVSYLYNECPSGCWGSPEKYHDWLSGGKTE